MMHFNVRLLGVSTLLALVVGLAPDVRAGTIVNGGFETGDFTGWTIDPASLGHVTTFELGLLGSPDWTPTEGDFFAYIRAGEEGVYTLLSQSFTANTGDVLSFDIFFDSNEEFDSDTVDDGFANLNDLGAGTSTQLFFSSSAVVGPGDTGWVSISHVIATAGLYQLEFGVRNMGDSIFSSAVGVDNVQLSVVPEPATLALGMLGALSGLGYGWRRRTRRA